MHRFTLLVTALATLSFAAPAPAQAPAEAKKAPTLTLAKLVAVRNLRCDALSRGKRARLRADIHRAELTGAFGPSKISVETQIAQSEAESGAAFEEAGNLRRRLEGMTERYVSDHRLLWYQTPDEAERVRLEDLIHGAGEIIAEPCID